MSKFSDFEKVKIVKKSDGNCRDEKVNEECKNFNFEGENFLENVDDGILYIDHTIKVAGLNDDESKNLDEKIVEEKSSECFSKPPKPLKEQISLPICDIDKISFYETFIISKDKSPTNIRSSLPVIPNIDNVNEVGSSSVIIEELENGNILIFMIQQIFDNNERSVHEILSIVTKDLKLVHEKRIERKCQGDESSVRFFSFINQLINFNNFFYQEQSLYIIATDKGFSLIKSMTTRDGTVEQFKGAVDWSKEGDFLARGGNVLMLRKLILEKFTGCVQSYFCNIDGEFALSQHFFHKPEQLKVFEEFERVQRVDQLLIFDNGMISKISCFFSSKTGHLLKQIWNNNSYLIHINPMLNFSHENPHDNWQKDIELMSKYFEYKAKRKEELKQKFQEPCVKSALHDYINSLIKCKPQSIMNFTLDYMRKLEQNTKTDLLKTINRRRIHE